MVMNMDIRRAAASALLQLEAGAAARWRPLPHQVPPPGDWWGWFLRGGRGSGKTDACANYVTQHVNGPPCMNGPIPHWIGIVAPTQGDAVTACVNGPSGIKAHDPSAKMVSGAGGLAVKWSNGSEAKIFGASSPDDIERLRAGGNRCLVWAEEMAAWRYLDDAFNHMTFGLRTGPRPHWIASTTPKPRLLIKKIMKQEGIFKNRVVITRATTYDNPHLQDATKELYLDAYEGTDLGAQELMAELIDQVANALWKRSILDEFRVRHTDLPLLKKISVGVDPSGGAGEQGIVVVGKETLRLPREVLANGRIRPMRTENHGYTIADWTANLDPEGWGRRAVEAAIEFDADDIVVETNYGGAMALATIRGAADHLGISIPIHMVTATRGKKVRAEPVAAMSTRGRWHMVGRHEELEDQLCTWTEDAGYSPDRLDAMVWPAWHQKMVSLLSTNAGGAFGGSATASTRLG